MKFLISQLAVALAGFLTGLFFPWWTFAVAALLIGALMPQKGGWNFVSGFLGIFLLWLGLTLWIDSANGGILSARMAWVLPMKGQVIYLHLLTAGLGGLIAGLASQAGKYLRALFPKEKY
ncbi:MAG: hypothetical protein FJX92_03880 [Bacteroidetes bacterium]|nr:hypothetical protein [Bacteroidota bacterium]